MRRSTLLMAIGFVLFLAFAGCSSPEEKKQSHLSKGREFFEKGEYKAARIELKNAVQIDPKFTAAQLLLAETSLKLGEAQEAFRAYAAVAELDPGHSEAQLKLATFLMLAQKFEESRQRVVGGAFAGAQPHRGAAFTGGAVGPGEEPV
jgi:Tfp pilus assembly protein PilF